MEGHEAGEQQSQLTAAVSGGVLRLQPVLSMSWGVACIIFLVCFSPAGAFSAAKLNRFTFSCDSRVELISAPDNRVGLSAAHFAKKKNLSAMPALDNTLLE